MTLLGFTSNIEHNNPGLSPWSTTVKLY